VREARQRIRTPGGGRLTQGDLATAVGVERNTVSRWENSGVCPKDPQVVRRLAAVLQVSMEWLLEDDDEGPGSAAAQGGRGAQAAGDRPAPVRERAVRIPYAASEVLAQRLTPAAYERVHAYIEEVERAGATSPQAEEVARLLLDAATTRLRLQPPRERPIATVLADIDAAWRYASTVLRGEGRGTGDQEEGRGVRG